MYILTNDESQIYCQMTNLHQSNRTQPDYLWLEPEEIDNTNTYSHIDTRPVTFLTQRQARTFIQDQHLDADVQITKKGMM